MDLFDFNYEVEEKYLANQWKTKEGAADRYKEQLLR